VQKSVRAYCLALLSDAACIQFLSAYLLYCVLSVLSCVAVVCLSLSFIVFCQWLINEDYYYYSWLRRRQLPQNQIWYKSAHGELLGELVKYNNVLFMPSFWELTCRSDRWADFRALHGWNDADSRRDVVLLILMSISGVIFPQNPIFGEQNE